MSNNKKYKIISNIENDAPSGDINWCTISFLTPQKLAANKYLDVFGFKVHNGYNVMEIANEDAKQIKERNKNHDVYLSQLGKIYAWDDATKTDSVEYDDQKLNELEENRRAQIDKLKLMSEQFKNEHKTIYANTDSDKIEAQRKRMQKKLYDKGLITKQEYELMQKEHKPAKEIKEMAASLEKTKIKIEECSNIDYLDENEPTGLKYGCLTIYSPKHIGGLKTLCFKIRGMFQTTAELNKRIKQLQHLYPNDRIYNFEIGKWCGFAEDDIVNQETLHKQLNYAMKCHLDNLNVEHEEFEKRKISKIKSAHQEGKLTQRQNRRGKRKGKSNPTKEQSQPINTSDSSATQVPIHENPMDPISSFGNPEDDAAIGRILNYLDDPELRNKYSSKNSDLQQIEMNLNK